MVKYKKLWSKYGEFNNADPVCVIWKYGLVAHLVGL
jgi:hypothetical protein